jgi:hypothetical protein
MFRQPNPDPLSRSLPQFNLQSNIPGAIYLGGMQPPRIAFEAFPSTISINPLLTTECGIPCDNCLNFPANSHDSNKGTARMNYVDQAVLSAQN